MTRPFSPTHATWPARFGFPERLFKAAASADSAGAIEAIASLHNLAIGILRRYGDRNIAAALGNAAQNIPICTRSESATYHLQGAHRRVGARSARSSRSLSVLYHRRPGRSHGGQAAGCDGAAPAMRPATGERGFQGMALFRREQMTGSGTRP
jgi:hypothetical protein